MENVKLLEELFDKKILKIIKFFILNKGKEFYLQEISKQVDVPIATVFRIVGKLKELEIVREIRIKRFKLYKCAENENVLFLESFIKEGKRIIDNFVSIISKVKEVQEIILYGKETEDKANVLLIGKGINSNQIKQISAEFKEKYNYSITDLCLEREQYEQMSEMGLYSGKKKTLFKR
jgi:Fe2+ or Zn2+ uptake regulation protein